MQNVDEKLFQLRSVGFDRHVGAWNDADRDSSFKARDPLEQVAEVD